MARRILHTEDKPIDEISNLWDSLTPEQLDCLRKNCVVRRFKKNEMVYQDGDRPTHLLCLTRGKLKITKKGCSGKSQIVRMIKPVEYTGYRAIFAEKPYSTSGVAFESSIIYFIETKTFLDLVFHNDKLNHFFLKQLAIDLGEADSRTVNLTQKHVRGRLAESLCTLIDSYGYEADNVTIAVYLSREDLANLSNMVAANVIRLLADFSKEGLLQVDGRIIRVVEEEQLRQISKNG